MGTTKRAKGARKGSKSTPKKASSRPSPEVAAVPLPSDLETTSGLCSRIGLDVPVLEHCGVVLTRLDLRMTPRQAKALRMVFDGLQSEGATVELVGRAHVERPVDAVRWMLDRIADRVSA